MAKRNYVMTEKKTQRWLKEGRGQGSGIDYKPWIEIHDFPSIGRVHRIRGLTTGRVHHLMSDGEARFFSQCDWQDHITDIWEQFPMDRDRTHQIARQLKIRPPLTEDGTPYVMTTDFVLVIGKGANRRIVSRTFKLSEDLKDRRVLEKFEIERRYWRERGIDWGIVTEDELDLDLIKNVETVRGFIDFKGQVETYPGCYRDAVRRVLQLFPTTSSAPLHEWCDEIDHEMKVDAGTVLKAAKHLIANKLLHTDMHDSRRISDRPLTCFHKQALQNISYGT